MGWRTEDFDDISRVEGEVCITVDNDGFALKSDCCEIVGWGGRGEGYFIEEFCAGHVVSDEDFMGGDCDCQVEKEEDGCFHFMWFLGFIFVHLGLSLGIAVSWCPWLKW